MPARTVTYCTVVSPTDRPSKQQERARTSVCRVANTAVTAPSLCRVIWTHVCPDVLFLLSKEQLFLRGEPESLHCEQN